MANRIGELPHALEQRDLLDQQLGGRRPAVFLDYDGVLTPIVERPEDAVISEEMRATVRDLAERCPVCVVSGRDRPVVQELMRLDNLVVAGSHGFDIWSPEEGTVEREDGAIDDALLEEVTTRLRRELDDVEGAIIEPKKAAVAVHHRLADDDGRARVLDVVQRILDDHADQLKTTPGKMVVEIQPNVDWDKGRAVLYLLETLELDDDDVVPLYLGDDITDEHAFEALPPRGIGVLVGRDDDPESAGRDTAADFVLHEVEEVRRLLDSLARP